MGEYLLRLRRFLYREFIPVTKGIIVLSIIIYAASWILKIGGIDLGGWLWLNPVDAVLYPWTVLSYAVVNDLISLIFASLWLWFVGSSLERAWGSLRYGWFVLAVTGVTGLMMAVVGRIFYIGIHISGFWLPLVGITWAWSELYPDQELLFWGILPVKARWLAWIHAALVFTTYAVFNPGLGFAAISSILLVYLNRRKGSGSNKPGGNHRRPSRHNRFKVIK